jgi:hypothetical protein
MDLDLFGPRPAHDSRRRLLLLWSCQAQVSSVAHLALHDVRGCGIIPVVLLGLLPHLLAYRQ